MMQWEDDAQGMGMPHVPHRLQAAIDCESLPIRLS
jgi:hypothetical protein